MIDLTSIKAALRDLGYSYEEGPSVRIRGYAGEYRNAPLRAYRAGSKHDIGFVKQGNFHIIVADWWGIKHINQKDFTLALTRRYAYHATIATLVEQGFSVAQEQVEGNGQVHLVLRRMV